MTTTQDFHTSIRKTAVKRLLFLPHAIRQMSRMDRMIAPVEVRSVINKGEIIEDYPENARGHSALLLGWGVGGRVIHVVCSPKEDYLAVITAYLPDIQEWSEDFRTRITS